MSQITRKDVPEEKSWNLADIFSSDEEWERSYSVLDKDFDEILKESISLNDAKETVELIKRYEQLLGALDRTSCYAMYKYSEDESDSLNQNMMGRSQILVGKGNNVTMKVVNALLHIPKEKLDQYIIEEVELLSFKRFLERIEEKRKHSLTPEMEEALASLSQTFKTPESLFLTVTSSDIKFAPATDRNGKEVPVSIHMYFTQIETSPDTILRRNAYQSLSDGLKKYQHGLAKTLAAEINKNVALAKLRGFRSAIDMLLQYSSPGTQIYSADGISSEFFESILDTFRTELSPHMQRYAKLRKRQLGLDQLMFSDVKAPLDPDFDPPISYQEAGEIITAAVGVLGPEYQEHMQRVFTERWVYRGDNVGRRMIAFGGGVHGVHGYSFYPWGGNLFDLMLLSHELGHTMHYSLSAENQHFINNAQSLLFAEAPSTMHEHLVVDYLRENRDDPRLHRWLNMYLMMSYHHNCVTHVLEAELLRRLYKIAESSVPLTTSIISETKGKILSEFWGDTVEIDEGAKLTWMRQPHYYMGLYPFTYSVGISASTLVAQRIKAEGQSVGEQWTEVVKKGGSMNGLDLYRMAGLDMSTTENLKLAIANIGRIVDELEQSF
ncbi:M3 family metallopeptidase [Bacillus sp. FJAT-29937]|uniref:M3 family metallopeptidase n=1 Tax=Bacillus sp. FJAT-29937 TaxID=1720553 RepID=UPI0008343902|nr:M3 family metallopeptidase [Bacillus sp. FJAT-29937]